MNSPVMLHSSAVLNAGQQFELEDAPRLVNPFQTAMFVDEVRFYMSPADAEQGLAGADLLGFSAELHTARVPLTNGFVPLTNFGKVLNLGGDLGDGTYSATWKLPRPLYLPKGEYLRARVRAESSGPLAPVTPVQIRVTYAGRSLPSNFPVPKVIDVPFVSAFTIFDAPATVDSSFVSTEADLVNPFDVPLHVQRFVGFETNSTLECLNGARGPYTTVRAADSLGRIMVRDGTPFGHLFSRIDRTWTVNSMLRPKGFYIFDVDCNWYTNVSPFAWQAQMCISMVGHRQVSLE